MRQRVALASVASAAVLGLLMLWGGFIAKPVSAMERMAENVRQAKTYKCTAITKLSIGSKHTVTRATGYWLAPDSFRMETTISSTWQRPGPEKTKIVPGLNKPCIAIDNSTKTFRHLPSLAIRFSPLERLENLGKFFGNAERDLGTKEIKGTEAVGFVINTEKIDPDLPPSEMEVWIDSETHLPVLLRCETKTEHGSSTGEVSDIQWNIDLAPELFDPTPPEDYKDVTAEPLALEEQVRQITEALKIYADASGGHYPRMKRFYIGTVTKDLFDMLGLRVQDGQFLLSEEDAPNARKLTTAIKGFEQIHRIQHHADSAYYGNTVGANDKEKVLFRWKLDDGRYEVIFGDLRSETATAERLRALDGK